MCHTSDENCLLLRVTIFIFILFAYRRRRSFVRSC